MPFPTRVVPNRNDIPAIFDEGEEKDTQSNVNVLQKSNVSNLIGLLNQLNSVSLHASEIFSDILVTTEKTGKRIQKVSSRLKAVESTIESTENLFLENAPSFFYDHPYTEKEWQRRDPLRGLLFRRDRAGNEVNRRREEGIPLPDLSKMDDISSTGPCIKKFSDSNFFMNEWLEAEKKKMEEEKAKRRERKKKRRRKKREVQKNIQGIEKWVYDPITGKKVKKKAEQIAVKQYNIPGTDTVGSLDFKSSESMQQSRVASMAQDSKSRKKSVRQKQEVNSVPEQQPMMVSSRSDPISPPPNPMKAGGGGPPPVPGGPGGPPGAAVPPPVPSAMNRATTEPQPGSGPPPVPDGQGGPPPVPMHQPQQQRRPLTPQEMAERSRNAAMESNAYRPPTTQPAAVAQQPVARRQNPMGGARSALLAGIQNRNVKLKAAPVVERKPKKLVGRDALMASLAGGARNLKKVEPKEEKEPEPEKVDATIFAILNRRQFMADDSDSDSGSEWDSDSS